MKKYLLILFSLPLFVFAERGNEDNKKYPRSESNSPCRNINPSARTCPSNEGFSLSLDFLYWRAQEEGFSYANDIIANQGSNIIYNTQAQATSIPFHSDWDFGFRVGMGWNTTMDDWDLVAFYTWFRNDSSQTRTTAQDLQFGGGLEIPWFFGGTATENAVKAKQSWKCHFDNVDLELGRSFYTSQSFSLRPFLGAKLQRVLRIFSLTAEGYSTDTIPERTFVAINSYRGFGPRAGVSMDFHLGRCWTFNGGFSPSLLYGRINAREQSRVPRSAADTRDNSLINVPPYWGVVPETEMSIGFTWARCFDNDMSFSLGAAWEVSYLWGLKRFLDPALGFATQAQGGNISFTGLTIRAKADF